MQVILREDIDNVGLRGEVVKVSAGYGRNFLLPRGLAVGITKSNLHQVEVERRHLDVRLKKEAASAEELKRRVEAIELTFKRKVGDSQTLYGSVTNGDVAEALAERGIEVDKRKVVLPDPLKELGNYKVPVKLHRAVQAEVRVYVVRED